MGICFFWMPPETQLADPFLWRMEDEALSLPSTTKNFVDNSSTVEETYTLNSLKALRGMDFCLHVEVWPMYIFAGHVCFLACKSWLTLVFFHIFFWGVRYGLWCHWKPQLPKLNFQVTWQKRNPWKKMLVDRYVRSGRSTPIISI